VQKVTPNRQAFVFDLLPSKGIKTKACRPEKGFTLRSKFVMPFAFLIQLSRVGYSVFLTALLHSVPSSR
jgi:hypothetical protein